MGYRISTLKNLPPELGCYYFLIGDYRNRSTINDLFREDFNVIADNLGESGAIVEKTYDRNMEYELIKALCHHPVLVENIDIYQIRMPGLLIMRKHPLELTKNDCVIYIPFQILESTYSNASELLWDLIAFAREENKNLIEKTKKKFPVIKGLSISVNMGIFALNIDL